MEKGKDKLEEKRQAKLEKEFGEEGKKENKEEKEGNGGEEENGKLATAVTSTVRNSNSPKIRLVWLINSRWGHLF